MSIIALTVTRLWSGMDRIKNLLLAATGAQIAVLFITIFLVDVLRSWYRLSHVPGPFWAALSKFWIVLHSIKGQHAFAIYRANKRYGPLVRIGPNELATGEPDVVRHITDPHSGYSRAPWYNAVRFELGKDNLFSMRDETRHMQLRKQMAPGYSGKENESMERTIDKHIMALVDLLQDKYLSTKGCYHAVDLAQKVHFYTIDAICDLAFTETFGFIKQDKDVYGFIKNADFFFPLVITLANIPAVLGPLHSSLFRRLFPNADSIFGMGAFIDVAKKKAAERFRANAKSQPDMLQSFINHGLSQEEVAREAVLNVVAGSETVATAIRITMLWLMSNPLAYAKLQKEIDQGIKDGIVSSPIKNSEAQKLPYLQAVIREGLRIKPQAAGLFFKTVPPEGDVINGKKIPGGVHIGMSAFAIFHSKEIFGQDAELFLPERWLDLDATQAAYMSSVVDLNFSAGKYRCLGRPVALMELNKMFVELLRRFDFAIARPEKPIHMKNAVSLAPPMRDTVEKN